jgi:hypothetical protein
MNNNGSTKDVQNFFDIFMSVENLQHILHLVKIKYGVVTSQYLNTLRELHLYIFNIHKTKIENEIYSRGTTSFQTILVNLNKISLNEFVTLIAQQNDTPSDTVNNTPPKTVNNTPPKTVNNTPPKTVNNTPPDTVNDTPPDTVNDTPPKTVNDTLSNTVNNTPSDTPPNTVNDTVDNYTQTESIHYMQSFHLFSQHCNFDEGTYMFKIPFDHHDSIHLKVNKIRINCDMFNITQRNNFFYIYENDNKIKVTLPLGYYNISSLINAISHSMTDASLNKYTYTALHNTIQNNVHIASTDYFTLEFVNVDDVFSLSNFLGFQQSKYENNSSYISEDHPKCNVFDKIFFKIFINNKELKQYHTNVKDVLNGEYFTFFDYFRIDYDSIFGKDFYKEFRYSQLQYSDVVPPSNDLDIMLQFYFEPNKIYNEFVDFDISLTLN